MVINSIGSSQHWRLEEPNVVTWFSLVSVECLTLSVELLTIVIRRYPG